MKMFSFKLSCKLYPVALKANFVPFFFQGLPLNDSLRNYTFSLKRGAFLLCDNGMNIILTFFFFFPNLAHIINHLVSWNLYFAKSLS